MEIFVAWAKVAVAWMKVFVAWMKVAWTVVALSCVVEQAELLLESVRAGS